MDLTLPITLAGVRRTSWRAPAIGLAVGALGLGGWLWLRDSSLVSVREVRIGGVRGAQAAQIESALRIAARRMTTMDFDARELRSAVSSFPVVEDVRVWTGFPHSVRIEVIERPPVATLSADGQRTALAADGTALGPALASSALPALSGSFVPVAGQRVSDPTARSAVALLGAAPAQIARFVERVFGGSEGLIAQMRNGLLVYFGDASRPHAKWLSLARVLADPGSVGARYVDVRVPERPAAGMSGEAPSAAPSTGAVGASSNARAEARAEGGSGAQPEAGGSAAGSGESAPREG